MNEILGVFEVVANEAGQVIVPNKLRRQLSDEVLLSAIPDGGLVICDPIDREVALEDIGDFQVFVTQFADAGLLQIPSLLLAHAHLDDGQVGLIFGFNRRVEFWEKVKWNEYYEKVAETFRANGNLAKA